MNTLDPTVPVRGQPDPVAPGHTERRHAGRLWARFDRLRGALLFRDGARVEEVDVGALLAQMPDERRDELLRRCCGRGRVR